MTTTVLDIIYEFPVAVVLLQLFVLAYAAVVVIVVVVVIDTSLVSVVMALFPSDFFLPM